jgi:proteasome activator subunit 4
MFQCVSPDIFNILPVACALESENKDTELRRECIVTLTHLAIGQLSPDVIQPLLDVIKQMSLMPSWHARVAVLTYLQVTVFHNLFFLQSDSVASQIKEIVLQLHCDEQLEVRELAGVTLGGFIHCGYLSLDSMLIKHFESLCATPIKKKLSPKGAEHAVKEVKPVTNGAEPVHVQSNGSKARDDQLVRRHAGVIGLSACILAYPYSVPEFVPQLLIDLSRHLQDPQPIQVTVKKTLATFKRTHTDSWHDHKQKFTDDQLAVLTELLVSPNYYA